ncbi:MAG: hypothetical protein RR479_04155, partial [Acinetobacter sp.]
IMNTEKYCFINGLKRRHANLIFGYNGNLYDRQLLGFITVEAAILSTNPISVKKLSNIWYVVSEYDWISNLCDDESYLLEPNYFPDANNFYHLSGSILSAFSNGVGLALDGEITTSYNLCDNDLNEVKNEVEQLKGRVIFFKSVDISSE